MTMMAPGPEFRPRPGALRFMGSDGEWICANPGGPLYSTVTMAAKEYWSEDAQKWLPIYDGDEEGT